jgi:RND family efflux transporter MFP subunit
MKPQKPHSWKKWTFVGAIALVAIGLVYSGMNNKKAVQYDTVLANRANLTQEVSITGNVKAAQSVDLGFEVSGRVEKINVEVGDAVKSGDVLVVLNSDDLKAQMRQAQAGVQSAQAQQFQFQAALEAQQARLADLRTGTRPEQIQIAQTAVYNAQKSWDDSKANLDTVKSKAEVDLAGSLNDAVTELAKAANVGKTSLLTLTGIQVSDFNDYDQNSISLANAKGDAVAALLGTLGAGRWTTNSLGGLTGGAFNDASLAQLDPTPDKVEKAFTSILDGLRKAKVALETVPLTSVVTLDERASLDAEKSNVNNEIISVSAKQQAIESQKALSQNSVTTAENQESEAKNALASARDELALEQAGSTPEQIKGQEAQVRQAEANISSQKASIAQAQANVQAIQARMDKMELRAPIDGIVTRQETKVGEIVTLSPTDTTTVVSLIGQGHFQIEANVAEVDIAKIKIGDPSRVTLDAYGSSVEFEATVTKIDPAETVIEGVPTYKTTFEFTQDDPRIRSGMTANIDIVTDKRENVVVVPQRAVIVNGADRTVRLLVTGPDPKDASETVETLKEVPVQVGIRGTDGNVEILSGVNEGDKVVTFIKQ